MAATASTPSTKTTYPTSSVERARWILARRTARALVDVHRPHAFLIEQERAAGDELAEVTTIFLTGRECPWRCLMCDLWKHTTKERTPVGAIPAQIDFAFAELGSNRSREAGAAINSPQTQTAGESVPSGQPSLAADSDGPFPLTPALSLGERETPSRLGENPNSFNAPSVAGRVPPLLGERAGVRGKDAHEHPESFAPSSSPARPSRHLKLYNSGSFFDRAAVPVEDYEAIARRAASFDRVIVESHPALIGDLTLRFRDLLGEAIAPGPTEVRQVLDCGGAPPLFERARTCESPTKRQSTGAVQDAGAKGLASQLEVAMGLETAHPEVLAKLNKRVTIEQFTCAANFLNREGIALRVFVLVKPPFMDEREALEWAVRSTQFAFDCGAEIVSLIPTRFGNGALEVLAAQGQFAPPRLTTLEAALEQGIALRRGRVFADTWDLEKFSNCQVCFADRRVRMERMNLEQALLPPIRCEHCT